MKFRTLQTLVIVGMVAAVVVATVAAAQVLLTQAARNRIEASISRAHEVFADSYARAEELHAAQAEVIANAPRLKAVVATGDVDRLTILDVALELQEAVGSKIFILLDGEGRLIADTQAPEVEGASLAQRPLVATALSEGRASAAWADEEGVYQVSARRLEFGREVVGVLILGHTLEPAFVASISTPTRAAASLSVDGQPAGSAAAEGEMTPELASALSEVATGSALQALSLPGDWLAESRPISSYAGSRSVRFTAGRSIDAAMEESRPLREALWIIGLISVLAGIITAYTIASRLARPLEDMADLAQRYGKGELDTRIVLRGPTEAVTLGGALHEMADRLVNARDELVAKERLEGEMEIAARIQTSILPSLTELPGLTIASHMQPADEVGGDYFDVIPQDEGCWLAVGDVAGHGLKAGLVMMMLQSAISVAARYAGKASPADLLTRVNATLYDNVRQRLEQDEHITLTLLRYHPDGRVVHAGAHEDLLIYRAATGEVDTIRTDGTWIGIVPDVEGLMPLQEFQLNVGDTLLLYSDGVTEARSEKGEEFGFDGLCETLKENAKNGPTALVTEIARRVAAHVDVMDDDVTLLAVKRSS